MEKKNGRTMWMKEELSCCKGTSDELTKVTMTGNGEEERKKNVDEGGTELL